MPLPILATHRLILQPCTSADLDALHALWTDPHVRRYLWDDVIITRERAAETLNAALVLADHDNLGHWTVREHRDGAVIGDVGYHFLPDSREIELLCCLLQPSWNRGLASEACRAALDYIWTTTSRDWIYARADLPNEDSIRLMRRLGMSRVSDNGTLVTYVLARPRP